MEKIIIAFVLSFVFLLPSANAQVEPVSHWSFDNSVNLGQDEIGGNDGTVYGAMWTSNGFKNGALVFDGVNDYVEIADSSSLNNPPAVTVEAWVKLDSYLSTQGMCSVVGKYVWSTPGRGGFSLATGNVAGGMPDDGLPGFIIFEDENYDTTMSPANLSLDTWYHLVGTYNEATGTIRIYVNGQERDTKSFAAELYSEGASLEIGRRTGTTRWFDGVIDEVKIYDRALTAQEILEQYNEGMEFRAADLNNDSYVDIYDLTIVTTRFGMTDSHQDWNATADVIQDGEIDIYDVVFETSRFSEAPPPPPSCSGPCRPSICDLYENCANGTGVCTSGYCCSGDCTQPSNGTVIWAASLSHADIQAAVDSASPGDTVMLPEGTNDNWLKNETLGITKPLTLMGQGPDKTILKLSEENTPKSMIVFYQVSGDLRFTGIRLEGTNNPSNADRGLSFHQCNNSTVRIWNSEFFGITANSVAVGGYPLRGVMWNCTIENTILDGYGYGTYLNANLASDVAEGDASWNDPVSIGTEYNFFIEDCTYKRNRHAIDGCRGARGVVRYNNFIGNWTKTNPVINHHAWGQPTENHTELRAWRNFEYYGNTLTFYTDQNGIAIRGGEGVIFNNTLVNVSWPQGWTFINHNCCTHPDWYGCTGAYPEKDQLTNTYMWDNTIILDNTSNSYNTPYITDNCAVYDPPLFVEGRDWFEYEKPGYTPYPYPHPLRAGL